MLTRPICGPLYWWGRADLPPEADLPVAGKIGPYEEVFARSCSIRPAIVILSPSLLSF
jgi:hypothetical protein